MKRVFLVLMLAVGVALNAQTINNELAAPKYKDTALFKKGKGNLITGICMLAVGNAVGNGFYFFGDRSQILGASLIGSTNAAGTGFIIAGLIQRRKGRRQTLGL